MEWFQERERASDLRRPRETAIVLSCYCDETLPSNTENQQRVSAIVAKNTTHAHLSLIIIIHANQEELLPHRTDSSRKHKTTQSLDTMHDDERLMVTVAA